MGQESEGVYYTSERGNPPIGGERSCLTGTNPLKRGHRLPIRDLRLSSARFPDAV